jgi:serpin B
MASASPTLVGYYRGAGVEAAELTYGDSLFSMTIVMPDEAAAIDRLVASLTRERWAAIVDSLEPSGLEVEMPKFKARTAVSVCQRVRMIGTRPWCVERANVVVTSRRARLGRIPTPRCRAHCP